ncbi:MAG: hypothetical protein JXQ30_13825 [Spirochaetes bacterium]|nr:hypothetical protein [Spirochaetota bacterium]
MKTAARLVAHAVAFYSGKTGEITFTEDEVRRYGKECIERHIDYMDNFYTKYVSDPHSLIINALLGRWWNIKEALQLKSSTNKETEERTNREKAHRELVVEQRKTSKYHEEARKFFELRRRV